MKIVVLEGLGVEEERLKSLLRQAAGGDAEVECFAKSADPAVLAAECAGADIAVLANMPFRREAITLCGSLKLLCVAFTGVDHVDLDACREMGIAVCNCAGYATAAVADLTFGLLLALERRILALDGRTRTGGTKDGLIGFELEGKTFGVVGAGAIGGRVAAIARAFGCRVLAYNRSPRTAEGVEFVDLDTLLRESDIVSLHVPLTPETRGMIGREELSKMKDGAVLLNTARGPVADSAAVAEALRSGKLAGAGIDVFDAEPPVPADDPLLAAPNCVFTPHIGFATHEAFEKRAVLVCENIASFLKGERKNRVD